MSGNQVVKEIRQGPAQDQGGPGAGAAGNADAAKAAAHARAVGAAATITERWKRDTKGLFDLGTPADATYTPALFRATVYGLLSESSQNGMTGDLKVAAESKEALLVALAGEETRVPYAKAYLEADRDVTADRAHMLKLAEAIGDLMRGGDVTYNVREMLGHYAPLSSSGKRWIAKAPLSEQFKAYIDGGRCAEHGALEMTKVTADKRPVTMAAVAQTGSDKRLAEVRPLRDMLVTGALGAKATDEKKAGDTPQLGPDGKPLPKPEDPNEKAATELFARIEKAVSSSKKNQHSEHEIGKQELDKLLKDIEAADPKVKDKLYAKPELMQRLVDLDPAQLKKVVGSLDTVQGLYTALQAILPQQHANPHAAGQPQMLSEEVFSTLHTYLLARPGKENHQARMRVLQHEQLQAHFINPLPEDKRKLVFKLVASGTLEETLVDKLRNAARAGNGPDTAKALMTLGNDSNGELQALRQDHLFRLEIEKVNKEVNVDGFPINPYHLCLTMWGLPVLSTADDGVSERQREVNPDGIYRPLTIEERVDLETRLLDPYAKRLRSEIAETIVDDADMKEICQSYEQRAREFEKHFRVMGKAPGPALVEHYNRKYNRDLRGEVNEYVSDGELVECNRILGFSTDSATVGVIGGKVREHDAPQPTDGPPRIVDLAQAMRETYDDAGTLKAGAPLSQITHDFADTIANQWMYEPGGLMYYLSGRYPGCSKDELLGRWRKYKALIESKRDAITKHTNLKPSQIHPIELLSNAVMEKGGDLAAKISRFFGDRLFSKGSAPQILAEMGLTPSAAAERSQAAQQELMSADPTKGIEQAAQQQFGEPARFLFKAISTLPASLAPEQIAPVVAAYKENIDKKLANAPELAAATMGSIEERPPRSFKAFYRVEYGVDPELHIARILKSHKDSGKDVAYAAQQFDIESKLELGIQAPLGEELKIDQRNQHLVRHDFKEQTAKDTAAALWKAIHEGTRFNVVITKLYTDFAKEEQRLIRIAFRELSGGLDLQFYIQQKLLQQREGLTGATVTEIGGDGTDKAKGITDKQGIDLGESDLNKLETSLTAAQHGTVDCYAMMRSAASTGDIDQMFRLADEAEQEDRAKILGDKVLMDKIKSCCDQVAWDRIFKTLTNQADLADRLYARAYGSFDTWNPFDATDEAGMRNDIKAYVKKLRRQFDRDVRAAEDKRAKAGEKPRDPDSIEQEITRKVKEACHRLMVNVSVRRIIEEELSAEELSDVEGLILNGGETNTMGDVARSGKDAEVIIAGIRTTPPEQRVKLRSDPAYLEKLAHALPDPNDYRQAMDALMSNRQGESKLDKVDSAATKQEPRELLRDLVDLDETELKKLRADPDMQAKLLAAFDDPDQRRLAREILGTKLREVPAGATDDERQQIAEDNRLAFLAQNAVARIRVPTKDKLGWPTMLEQCIEVYKMELEPRVRVAVPGGPSGFVAHSDSETTADRKLRDDKAKVARHGIWQQVKVEVAAWAKVAAKDKPDVTQSEAKTDDQMVDVVHDAVLKVKDPSAERIKNNLGNTYTYRDEYGERTVERDDNHDGLKAAIRGASQQILVDEWSNVKRPRTDGGPSMKVVYDEFVAAKQGMTDEAKATPEQSLALQHKRLAFMDYVVDISDDFEQLVLPHVGSADERKLTKDGGTSNLRERDNKKYNELVDLARERLVNLTKGDGRYVVAKAIGCAGDDFALLDTPNRDAITALHYRDSKFLRSRGTQAGSGWAADKEAQVIDQRMMQYGHEVSAARTNIGPEGTGIITQQEGGRLEERGVELDRAIQAFKDAKAKVAFWMSMIIGVLVTAVLTVLTGGLATGPLAALFFTTAIAGVSAGAKALVNEAVLAEDYDLKDEGVKMIGREMLTAFITAGTTMIAQRMVAGVSSMTTLGSQARAAEQVMRTPPPLWHRFLAEGSEEIVSETMSGTIDAALIAIDPMHWMHGVAEGRDRALPAAMAELEKVPMRALKGGITSAVTAGILSGKKKELQETVDKAGKGGTVNIRENFKQVFGANTERIVATFVEWSVDTIGKGKIDLDKVPADLLERFLQEVAETNIETHTGTAHERSRSGRAQKDLARAKERLTEAEQRDFLKMQASAQATDPYISLTEYVRVRNSMAADALFAWSQRSGKTLTEAQVKAFIQYAREADTADDFQARLNQDPESIPAVQAAKDAPAPKLDPGQLAQGDVQVDQGTTIDDTANKTETSKQSGTMTTDTTKPVAVATERVAVVQTVATVEEGYALMRRLAGGDQTALPGGFAHDGRTDAVEWGLGRKPDGSIVMLRGRQGDVDFDKIPGIVALAHSHPAVLDGKPRDLDAVTKAPGGVAISELLTEKNSNDLFKFLPSTGDLGYFTEKGIGSHVVFTPYVHVGEHKVGNPSAQATPAQRIEIEVRNARLAGRSALQQHRPAYTADIIIRDGAGNVLWTGPMFAVRIAAGTFSADQPSLTPQFIEQGQLPLPDPEQGEAPKPAAGQDGAGQDAAQDGASQDGAVSAPTRDDRHAQAQPATTPISAAAKAATSPATLLGILEKDPLLELGGNTPESIAATLKDNPTMLGDYAHKLLQAKGIMGPTQSQLDLTIFKLNEAIKKGKWQSFEAPFDGAAIKAEDNVEQRLGNIFGEMKVFSPRELETSNLRLSKPEQEDFRGAHASGLTGQVLAASFINTQHRSEGDFSHAYGEDAWNNFQAATALLDAIPKGQLLQKLDVELMIEVNRLIHTPDVGIKAKLLRFIAMIGRGFTWDKGGELRTGTQFARPDTYSAEEIENMRQAGVHVDVLMHRGGDNNLARLVYPDADQVRPKLETLLAELKEALAVADADPVNAAADFQRRFVALHPFGDSNGRTSRVVMNRILAEFDMPPAIYSDQNRDLSTSQDDWRTETRKGVLRSKQYIQANQARPKGQLLTQHQIRALQVAPDQPVAIDGRSFALGADGLLYDPLGRPYLASGTELVPLAQMEHLMFARRIIQSMSYQDPAGSPTNDWDYQRKGMERASENLRRVTEETRALYDRIAQDPSAAQGITVRSDAQAREADSEYKLAPSPEVGKLLADLTDLSQLDSTRVLKVADGDSVVSGILSKYAQTDLDFWQLERGLRETNQPELADQVRARRVALFEMAKAELAKHRDALRVSAENPQGFRFKYEKMMYDRSPLRFESFDAAVAELGDNTITIWRGDYSFARIIGMAPNNDIRQPDAKAIAAKRWDKNQLTNMYDDFARLQGSAVGRQYISTTTDLALLTAGTSSFATMSNTQMVNLSSLPSFLRTRVLAWIEPSWPADATDADKEKSRKESLERGEKIVPTSDGGKEIRNAFGVPGTILKVKVHDKDAGTIQVTADRKAFELTVEKDSLVPGIEAIAGPTFEFEQEMYGLEAVRPWHIKAAHEAGKLNEEFPAQQVQTTGTQD
jgi:hypothetical protein